MQLPDYNDPIIRLQREIKRLEEKINRLSNSTGKPTIPIYTPQNLSDFVEQQEGEFWINSSDGKLYYQYTGTNKVTSVP